MRETAAGTAAAAERAGRSSENPKNQVQSVAKAFAVLKAFGQDLPALTIAEVAVRAGLDRGTAFRLIQTLAGLGYLRPVPDGRRYRLTLKCLELGFSALSADDLPGHAEPLLRDAVPAIAFAHHERLDGGGYPRGLRREEIPLQSRAMAIADVFDALTAQDRPYKAAVPLDRSLAILEAAGREGHLDAELLELFIRARVYERAVPSR